MNWLIAMQDNELEEVDLSIKALLEIFRKMELVGEKRRHRMQVDAGEWQEQCKIELNKVYWHIK